MKTLRIPSAATWAIVCALAFPAASFAKDHKKHKDHHEHDGSHSRKNDGNRSHSHKNHHSNDRNDDYWRQQGNGHWNQNQNWNQNCNRNWNRQQTFRGQNCATPSISGLLLSLVSGFSQAPQVRYYAPAAPRTYYQNPRGISLEASVQLALVRAGYYNGPIDGCMGPRTRQAIANYQASRGLRVTGNITDSLLAALGL